MEKDSVCFLSSGWSVGQPENLLSIFFFFFFLHKAKLFVEKRKTFAKREYKVPSGKEFFHLAARPERNFFKGWLQDNQNPSGYVRKYYDVKNRAFLRNFMRDFCHFYAQFLFFNHSKYIKCENRAFSMENMRVFLIVCVKSRIARP